MACLVAQFVGSVTRIGGQQRFEEFDVDADGVTTMVLDFDGDRSIHVTGNQRYMMTPVIAVASVSR